jgi:hypothetical protein
MTGMHVYLVEVGAVDVRTTHSDAPGPSTSLRVCALTKFTERVLRGAVMLPIRYDKCACTEGLKGCVHISQDLCRGNVAPISGRRDWKGSSETANGRKYLSSRLVNLSS